MQNFNPLIDERNPFYCPELPAAVYLKSLRSKVHAKPPQRRPSLARSFARVLEQTYHEDGDLDSGAEGNNTIGSDWILGDSTSGQGWFSSQPHALDPEDLPPYLPTMPLRTKLDVGNAAELASGANAGLLGHPDLKRKSPFSDFGAPPKYARSVQSVHASSFDIEVFHEKLQYNRTRSSPMTPKELLKDLGLMDDLKGSLIARMDAALPGMRLKERLFELGHDTPQAWMDFLSDHGYINARVLDILRTSAIERIVFAPSMFDENGLNLPESNIYSVFGKADSFSFLSEISFANVRICDSDIQYIHHLPNLSALNLNGTGIGNEGVFLLVSLKRTLKKLSLATNPDIDNDAIPAILLLSLLSFLSILDTSIEMVGLRRLAEAMHTNHWIMDIKIPYACEVYVDNINSQYLYSPVAPLITNSHVCPQLSSAALKRNLEAHAVCNPSIVPSGTRPEMVERLSTILKIRTLDMLVISMLEGNEFVSGSK